MESKRRWQKLSAIFGSALLVLIAFQNCSPSGFKSASDNSLNSPSTDSNPPGPGTPPAEVVWNVPTITLIQGGVATFDLNGTLPEGVTRGGTFAVDTTGSLLPPGMTLSQSGVLSVGSASAGDTSGIIFTYEPPL